MMPLRVCHIALSACLAAIVSPVIHAQDKLPTTWVDKDTGHRVYRLTNEERSSGFYFNNNAYSPDGRFMVYTAPDGIHTMELATKKTKLLVPNPPLAAGEKPSFRSGVHAIVVGKKPTASSTQASTKKPIHPRSTKQISTQARSPSLRLCLHVQAFPPSMPTKRLAPARMPRLRTRRHATPAAAIRTPRPMPLAVPFQRLSCKPPTNLR